MSNYQLYSQHQISSSVQSLRPQTALNQSRTIGMIDKKKIYLGQQKQSSIYQKQNSASTKLQDEDTTFNMCRSTSKSLKQSSDSYNNQFLRLHTQQSNYQNLRVKTKDVSQIIPNQIKQDKEDLYKQVLDSKKTINELNSEIYYLKAQTGVNRGSIFCERTEEDVFKNSSNIYFQGRKTSKVKYSEEQQNFVQSLKRQLKQAQNDIDDLKDDIQNLKRKQNVTRFQEIEVELKAYQDECMRLQYQLKQLININPNENSKDQDLQENYFKCINLLDQARQELTISNQEIKIYKTQIKQLKEENQSFENQVNNLAKDKVSLKKEVDQLKQNNQRSSLNNQVHQKDTFLKTELERKIQECDQLIMENQSRQIKFQEQDEKNQKLIEDIKEQLCDKKKQLEILAIKFNFMQSEYIQLQVKYDTLLAKNKNLEETKAKAEENNQKYKRTSLILESNVQQKLKHSNTGSPPTSTKLFQRRTTLRKLNAVTEKEVENLRKEIIFKLRSKFIGVTDIMDNLYQDKELQGSVSIAELIDQLQKYYLQIQQQQLSEPFKLHSNDAVKLSRYLIESQTSGEEEINYNVLLCESVKIVKERLVKFIGNYELFRPSDERDIVNSIIKNISEEIIKKLQTFASSSTIMNVEEIAHFFRLNKFTQSQEDFIFWKSYEHSKELKTINIQWFLDQFVRYENSIAQQFTTYEVFWPPRGQVKVMLDSILDFIEYHYLDIKQFRYKLDSNKNGELQKEELVKFFSSMGINLTQNQIDLFMKFVDKDNNDSISAQEITDVIQRLSYDRNNKSFHQYKVLDPWVKEQYKLLSKTFRKYMLTHGKSIFNLYVEMDPNGDGYLNLDEFQTAMKTMTYLVYTTEEAEKQVKILKSFDKNGDGDVSLDEFYECIRPLIFFDKWEIQE